MWKKTVIVISAIVILIIGMGVKNSMDRKAERNELIGQATKELQEEVSKYIVENYEGITKIEWLGWKINPMGTIRTEMLINDYPGEYVSDFFKYNVEEHYNAKSKEKFTDEMFAINNPENEMQEFLRNDGVKKSKKGSKDVIVIYNSEEQLK